jgi:hypothetical protein
MTGSSYNQLNGGAAALAFVEATMMGKPYVFGGDYPPLGTSVGTDCSGLVQLAYHHVGVNLPRTTEEQCNVAQIPLGSIKKPGDCLYFTGSPTDPPPGHVGIYVGVGSIGVRQHEFLPNAHGAAVMFNAPYTDDPYGIRYDYVAQLAPILFITRPANLLPEAVQRLIKGMTYTPNIPMADGDWLVYGGKKAGIPNPAELAKVLAAKIPEKQLNDYQIKALDTVEWGEL